MALSAVSDLPEGNLTDDSLFLVSNGDVSNKISFKSIVETVTESMPQNDESNNSIYADDQSQSPYFFNGTGRSLTQFDYGVFQAAGRVQQITTTKTYPISSVATTVLSCCFPKNICLNVEPSTATASCAVLFEDLASIKPEECAFGTTAQRMCIQHDTPFLLCGPKSTINNAKISFYPIKPYYPDPAIESMIVYEDILFNDINSSQVSDYLAYDGVTYLLAPDTTTDYTTDTAFQNMIRTSTPASASNATLARTAIRVLKPCHILLNYLGLGPLYSTAAKIGLYNSGVSVDGSVVKPSNVTAYTSGINDLFPMASSISRNKKSLTPVNAGDVIYTLQCLEYASDWHSTGSGSAEARKIRARAGNVSGYPGTKVKITVQITK